MKQAFRLKLFAVGLLSISSMSHAAMRMDYDTIENIVKERNKNVAATRLELRGVEKRMGYLRRSFIPTGEASLSQEKYKSGPFDTMTDPMYSLRAELNLFRGGRDSLEEDAREAQRQGKKIEANRVVQEELLEARTLYWNLVYYREVKKLYEGTLAMNKKNLSGALRRINAGLATKTDRLEFEVSDIQLTQDLARIVVAISIAQRKLAAVLALPAETEFDTAEVIAHEHNFEPSSLSFDFNTFRDVQSQLASNLDLEARGKILKRWWTPTFDLYAESVLYNYRERNFGSQQDRIDNAFGMKLTFNFDGLQLQRDGESLVAQSGAAKLRAEQIRTETEASFNTAKQELTLLHDLIHEGEKSVAKGEDYLSSTTSEYARGVKNSVDVLSATMKQLDFKKRFAELRRDYAISKAQVESLMSN